MKLDKSTSRPARRITPADEHYFFGYYDLQPFNLSGTYHLAHKTSFMDRLQKKGDVAELGVINMNNYKYERIETTRAWNFQQGAMLQWNPKEAEREIIYNDIVDGEQVGVVMDIFSGKKRYLERPVANVSQDGKYALSINMSRLYDFRPGYGYAEPADPFYYKKHAKDDGVFLIDMETGKSRLVLSMEEIWNFSGSYFHNEQKMIINHITFNKSADRFLLIARNFSPEGVRHADAFITVGREGDDMFLLSDYGVQSHYYWLDDKKIIAYSDGKELDCCKGRVNTYIFTDKTHDGHMIADGFFRFDNHMSFSPDNKVLLNDSYPDDVYKMQKLMVYNFEKNKCVELGRYYSLPSSITDIRCDLHPRWDRMGNIITFDSTHEGYRGIYAVEYSDKVFEER